MLNRIGFVTLVYPRSIDLHSGQHVFLLQCVFRTVSVLTARGCVCAQGLMFTGLPPGLANGTVLEVFDLWGNVVSEGVLPPEYSAWTSLGVFK